MNYLKFFNSIRYLECSNSRDILNLFSRILMMLLYAYFGFFYVTNHNFFVNYLIGVKSPLPELTSIISNIIEVIGSVFIILGFFTRPTAIILSLYTIGTGVIGHAFWNYSDPIIHHSLFVHFFKNVSISAGFIFLAILGPGKFSLDKR